MIRDRVCDIIRIIVAAVFALGVVCGCCSCGSKESRNLEVGETDWPQWGKDSQRTAFAINELELPLDQVWQNPVKETILDNPMCIGGKYIIVNTIRGITCFNKYRGEMLWSKVFEGKPLFPIILGDIVVCGIYYDKGVSGTGHSVHESGVGGDSLVGICSQNGETIWELELHEEINWQYTDYSLCKDKLIFVTNMGRVLIVDIDSGSILKEFTPVAGERCARPIVLDDDKLYIVLGENYKETNCIFAIDMNEERAVWKRQFEYSVVPVCYYDDSIIITPSMHQESGPIYSEAHKIAITCLNAGSGDTKWEFGLDPKESSWLFPGVAYSPEQRSLYFGHAEGREHALYCLNAVSGELIWKRTLNYDYGLLKNPIISGGTGLIVIWGGESRLIVYDIATGEIMEVIDSNGTIISAIVSGKRIYTCSVFEYPYSLVPLQRREYEGRVTCYE